tara:strand:+ start:3429 stop:4244 length:816 start_codon:yes stop_codon:yes gene_type:complete
MADEQVDVAASEAPVSSPEQQSDDAALARYQESQKTVGEKEEGLPDGYNADGTPQEDLIAGKFKSQEDLLTAYQELEKKLGQPKEEVAPEVAEAVAEVTEVSGDVPFSTVKYEDELGANGKLSDESYTELDGLGFSKQQVDRYIQGQTSYAESVRSEVFDSVGGEAEYGDLVQWAADNMPADMIEEYNTSVENLDQTKALRTLEYMKFKRDQEVGTAPRRLEGDSVSEGLQPFTDKNEWQRAQTNRLYGKDAKYTNMVDARYLAARKRNIL